MNGEVSWLLLVRLQFVQGQLKYASPLIAHKLGRSIESQD